MPGVLSLFKPKPKHQPPTWREMLELRPVRNPALEWLEENERVVLCLKNKNAGNWKARIAHWFVPIPEERRVALDAIGSDVWHLLDGKNTVGRIAKELAKKYKLQPREAELSLQQYFKELGRRGYIAFITKETGDGIQNTEDKKRKSSTLNG